MKKYATWVRQMPKAYRGGRWTYDTLTSDVEVMAVVAGYAMIRHKGCVPIVAPASELQNERRKRAADQPAASQP